MPVAYAFSVLLALDENVLALDLAILNLVENNWDRDREPWTTRDFASGFPEIGDGEMHTHPPLSLTQLF